LLLPRRRFLVARRGFFKALRSRCNRRRQRLFAVRLQLLAGEGLAALVLAQLVFLHQEGGRRARRPGIGLRRTLVAPLAVAVAPASIAAAAAALLVFAFPRFWRSWLVRGLALLRLSLLRLSLLWLGLLRWPRRTLLRVGPASPVASATPFASLAALAALRLLAVSPLLESRLLLAIAVLFGAAVAALRVPVAPVIAARLVTPGLALRRLRRPRCGRGHGRRRRRGRLEQAEDAAEEARGRLGSGLRDRQRLRGRRRGG
jgi:hypothetical protein